MLFTLLLVACAAPTETEIEIDLTTTETSSDDHLTAIEISDYDASNPDRCVVYDNSPENSKLGEFAVILRAWVDVTVDVFIGCDRGGSSDVPLVSVNNPELNDPTVDIRITDVPCADFLDGTENCFGVTYYLE